MLSRRGHRLGRPFVYLNVAMTADGKIAPANRRFEPFSSKDDQRLLMELRTGADAVMSGARTVDSSPVTLGPGGLKYRRQRIKKGLTEYNLRVIVSGSGSVDPQARIFKYRFSPIIVLTSERAPLEARARLEALGAHVEVFGRQEVDFARALRWLRREWNVKRLLCEGGGEVNGALFEAGLVDEVYATLCPLILGGAEAPTLADHRGAERLANAARLKLKSLRRVGHELFLIYRVTR